MESEQVAVRELPRRLLMWGYLDAALDIVAGTVPDPGGLEPKVWWEPRRRNKCAPSGRKRYI